MIWLFTSASEKKFLYKRDFLNVCCEPSGTIIHFGYSERWVPDGFTVEDNVYGSNRKQHLKRFWNERIMKSPKYQNAVIFFCEEVSKVRPFYRYHPIRLARIIDFRREGRSRTFVLRLEGFFKYENYDEEKEQKLQKYVLNNGVHPGLEPYRWVRQEKNVLCKSGEAWYPTPNDFSSQPWLPLIEHVSTLVGLSDSIFFSVQRWRTFGGPPHHLFHPMPTYKPDRCTFSVKSGRSYKVILYMIPGKDAKYREPELKISASVASVSGPFLRQRSAGIEADFEIVFQRTFQQQVSMVELRVPRSTDTPDRVDSPEIQALVRVRVPWTILVITVVALSLGAIFAVISPAAVDEFAGMVYSDPHNWIKEYKLLVFTLTKAIAFVAIGVGTFLGFNKLPFKAG